MTDRYMIDLVRSKYGLLFTKIRVDDRDANALIDFGDPNSFQLSTSFVERSGVQVTRAEGVTSDFQGNKFDLFEGRAGRILVSSMELNDVAFLSGHYELEHVSKEVKTKIDAVIGWGFFKDYYLELDYDRRRLVFSKHPLGIGSPFYEAEFEKSDYLVLKVGLGHVGCNVVLDTGCAYSVIDESFFNANERQLAWQDVTTRRYVVFPMKFNRIRTKIGDGHFPVDYLVNDLSKLEAVGAVGILGGSFLSQFVVAIEPANNRILLHPKSFQLV